MGKKKTDLTVIFDFDGTLANTLDLIVRIYNDHAEQLGMNPVTPDQFSDLRTMGYKKAMKHLNIRWFVVPRLIMLVRKEMKAHMGEVKPYRGAIPMLVALKQAGVGIGVLTSNEHALVQEFLQANDFPAFDFVVSEKTVFGKEKALERIIERHKLSKDHVIYVGDEPRDVASSKKAGVRVYGVTWGLGGVEAMEPAEPDMLFSKMSELKKALLSEV